MYKSKYDGKKYLKEEDAKIVEDQDNIDQIKEERNLNQMLPSGLLEEISYNKHETFFSENEEATNDGSGEIKSHCTEYNNAIDNTIDKIPTLGKPSRNHSHHELTSNYKKCYPEKELIESSKSSELRKDKNKFNSNY